MKFRTAFLPAVLAAIAPSLCGQSSEISVLQLDDEFHLGTLGLAIPISTPPGAPQVIFSELGTARFDRNWNFTVIVDGVEIDSNLQSVTFSGTDGGTYRVLPSSRIELDANPSQPGTDTEELFINRDATVILSTRESTGDDPAVALVLQKSTGQSNASLNGDYRMVSMTLQFTANGLVSSSEIGTIQFDGAGNFSLSGQVQTVQANGTSSVAPMSDTGSYAVASDGAILDGNQQPKGAISPDANIFFMTEWDAPNHRAAIVVGVKLGTGYTMDDIEGIWAGFSHEIELGSGANLPESITISSTVEVGAQSSTMGAYRGDAITTSNNASGSASSSGTIFGTVAANSGGEFRFQDAFGATTNDYALSENGDFYVGSRFNGRPEMSLGLRICGPAGSFGTATPGAGTIAPEIGMSEFPWVGNNSFALRVVAARGRAPGVFVISTAPGPGFPVFGGMFWLDPTQIVTIVPTGMSGTLGAAGQGEASLPLPVPALPYLAGAALYSQVLILDGGAIEGIAMTKGFELTVSL